MHLVVQVNAECQLLVGLYYFLISCSQRCCFNMFVSNPNKAYIIYEQSITFKPVRRSACYPGLLASNHIIIVIVLPSIIHLSQ